MNRSDLLQLLEAGLAAGQPVYVRQAAQRYLLDWPGDLAVQLALARAYGAEGRAHTAVDVLTALVAADPEAAAALRQLADQQRVLNDQNAAALSDASAHVLDGLGRRGALPDWAMSARAAYLADHIGDWDTAQREAQLALRSAPTHPLVSLLALAAVWHVGRLDLARPLVESYHARWPDVVAFRLCLAECLLAAGDHPRAIALLHDAAAKDVGGQVVIRHWGRNHPYRALWENAASPSLPGPLPAELMAMLGLNQLRTVADPAGGKTGPGAAEELAAIQAKLDELAARLPSAQAVKHRLQHLKRKEATAEAPAAAMHYVFLSSRTRLTQVYGAAGFVRVDAALRRAGGLVLKQTGMATSVLYVDDPATLSPFGLRPANPTNAWDIKVLIGKLAGRLKNTGSTLGAVLIVGGPDVIPFHHLPNPTDDADADIPSDNPYATADNNYFVPEWPIARLPTGAGADPAPLLDQINRLGGSRPAANRSGYSDWLQRLQHWLREQYLHRARQRSFGYSANVWRSASAAVYHQIGDPKELLTCPPLDANALPLEGLSPSRLSYFNLHGIEDGAEWYGQRSVDDPGSLPEYPIALRPADVSNHGRAPVVVFSEACYGANVIGKQTEEALCLKFLASGSRVVVGSTKIAYGSVTTPLVGADLLGRCFWQNLTNGVPAGEALRRAKLQMAQEMQSRQGFLDGEDQKTLISFILYGDPLATAPEAGLAAKQKYAPLRLAKTPAATPTVCDKTVTAGAGRLPAADITPEMVSQIKSAVARYLPGMSDAHMQFAQTHTACLGTDHTCPTAQLARSDPAKAGAKNANPATATTVVTLSKSIRSSSRLHPHYARLTLDASGAVIKVAVSR
jgi:tetratricopeptide (TPR) repeat protein